MVCLRIVDAAIANVTNATFAHQIGLVDGPLGLKELESTLIFPPRDGKSWTVSIQTSDIAAAVFTILVLSFAIDHYLFNSRYLVHIGGAARDKDHEVALDEKASLHEKEALSVEAGQFCRKDEDSDLKPKPGQDSNSPASTARSRPVLRVVYSLLLLFLFVFHNGKKKNHPASQIHRGTPESSSAKAEGEGKADKSAPTSRWGEFVQRPWVQGIVNSAILLLGLQALLTVVVFNLLFWPLVLTLFILLQCLFHEELTHATTAPWQSIALKSAFHLAIWTIIAVTLLLKPNRFQGMLWKGFKWTHAVSWWLFWAPFECYYISSAVATSIGLHYSGTATTMFMFIMRPLLVVYLYSGFVRDALAVVWLCKYLWNNDVTRT